MEDASVSASWLQELVGLMGYQATVEARLNESSPEQVNSNSKNYWLEISSDNLQSQQIQRLIGQDGIVIDSLQYFANVLLNQPERSELGDRGNRNEGEHNRNHNFYTIELNGYRVKRLTDLQAIADQAVQEVRDTQTEFVIKQLSAADRRHIHQLLEAFPDIETYSQGREPNRHLIVKLVQL
jgi:spoIIIJ-associated protein